MPRTFGSSLLPIALAAALLAACAGPHTMSAERERCRVAAQESVVNAGPAATTPVAPVLPAAMAVTFEAQMSLARGLSARPDDAVAAYAKAAALAPKRAEPHVAIARLLLAKGEAGEARQHALQATKLSPESSAAWNTLGRSWFLEGQWGRAAQAFGRATEANRRNAYAWNNLGLSLLESAQYEEAAYALEEATSLPRPEAYMWQNLAHAYEHLGLLKEAREAYGRAADHSAAARADVARIDIELRDQPHVADTGRDSDNDDDELYAD